MEEYPTWQWRGDVNKYLIWLIGEGGRNPTWLWGGDVNEYLTLSTEERERISHFGCGEI